MNVRISPYYILGFFFSIFFCSRFYLAFLPRVLPLSRTLAGFYFAKISEMTRGRSMKREEVRAWGDPVAPGVLTRGVRERERGGEGNERGAAKGGRRESVRRECGPPMACEPTRAPLVRYFGIKAKQPLLDVTHESASAHPGVLDSYDAPAR